MATRGHKPGQKTPEDVAAPRPYHERENPERLIGDELRELAHRHGMARSDLARMTDEKIRLQMRYIINRRGGE